MDDKFGGLSLDDINNAASFNDAAGASSNNHAVPPAGGTPNYGYPPPPNNRRPGPAAQIQKPDAGKKRKRIIITSLISVFAACIVVLSVVFVVSHIKKTSESAAKSKETAAANTDVPDEIDWDTIDAVSDGFKQTQDAFAENGYVKPESFVDAVVAAKQYADTLVEAGTAETVVLDENGTISVRLSSGEEILFAPMFEGTMSGGGICRIVTFDPCDDLRSNDADVAADLSELDAYSYEETDANKPKTITLDTLKNMKNASVVLWSGHGLSCKEEVYLSLGSDFDKEEIKKLDKTQWAIGDGNVCLKSAFFDKQFASGDFDGTIFYFGACQIGQVSTLADILIQKGASVVFAPSDTISGSYSNRMLKSIFKHMKNGLSAGTALQKAKQDHGDKDHYIAISEFNEAHFEEGFRLLFSPAEIRLFGDQDKCLQNGDASAGHHDSHTGIDLQNELWEQHLRNSIRRTRGSEKDPADAEILYNEYVYSADKGEIYRYKSGDSWENRETIAETVNSLDFYVVNDYIYHWKYNNNHYNAIAANNMEYHAADCYDLVRCRVDGSQEQLIYSGIGIEDTVLDFKPDFHLAEDSIYIVGYTSKHGGNATFLAIDQNSLDIVKEAEFYNQGEPIGDSLDVFCVHQNRCYFAAYQNQIGTVRYIAYDMVEDTYILDEMFTPAETHELYNGDTYHLPSELSQVPFDEDGVRFENNHGAVIYSFAEGKLKKTD